MASNRFNFLELGEAQWPNDKSNESAPLIPVEEGEPMGPAHVQSDEAPQIYTQRRIAKPLAENLSQEYPQSDKRVYDEFAARQWAMERESTETSAGSLATYLTHQADPSARVRPIKTELKAVEAFGSRGSGAGEFNSPMGLAVDRTGILFVADFYNHRVQRITPDGGVAVVGSKGTNKTQFLAPVGIAVDADRSFYVVEQGNNRVQKFSFDGVLELVFGREGRKYGEFMSPTAICISPFTGEILVTDSGNSRVQRFNLGGDFLGALGSKGSIHPPLTNPQSVTCDYLGNIFVVDTLANRIARYDPMGRFTGHFGGKSISLNGEDPVTRFVEPRAAACTTNGKLIVSEGDTNTGRLVVLDAQTGTVETAITAPARQLGKLSRPSGVAVSPRLRTGMPDGIPRTDAYVADTMNHRIIRFESK